MTSICTRKTLQIQRIAAQRNQNLRQQFKAEISVFRPEQLVFLDETGIVCLILCTTIALLMRFFVYIMLIFNLAVIFCLG